MNQSILSVRVNTEDKKKFENFCSDAGMNVSTAINVFIKAVLREQRLPFEIKTDNYEQEIFEKLSEAEKEMLSTDKRYTHEEVINHLRDIIG